MEPTQPQFFTQAVRLAQGEGYDVVWDESMVCYIGHDYARCLTNKEIWSDRDFWFFLSKAKGYGDEYAKELWHNFVEHLYEKKDPEDYFEPIVK